MGKYIVVMYGEIGELKNVLPWRIKGARKLALSYLDHNLDANKEDKCMWSRNLSERPLDGIQKRMMLVLTMKAMTTFVMRNHIYRTGDQFYIQETGGHIGLKITTILAGIIMGEWDKQFNRMMDIRGIVLPVYKRYVDDVDIVYKIGPGNTTGVVREDVNKMIEVANGIMDCIVMEEDNEENYTNIRFKSMGGRWRDSLP